MPHELFNFRSKTIDIYGVVFNLIIIVPGLQKIGFLSIPNVGFVQLYNSSTKECVIKEIVKHHNMVWPGLLGSWPWLEIINGRLENAG